MKEPLGLNKKSFRLFFAGGEIWIEHLDGIFNYTDLAIKKFENDYLEFKRPSFPSLIAINLDETEVSERLIHVIAEKLLCGEKHFRKVVFVGTNRKTKFELEYLFINAPFAYHFINDFEIAKEWLLAENGKDR